MNKNVIRQILVVLATLATIVVNGLANALPINGLGTGEISDMFDVFFVPAGYVFSIWGLIYLGLLAYSVYQALPSQRENAALQKIGYLYIWSSVANIVWLFFWHYLLFPLTLLAMLVILGLLIAIYLRLDIGRTQVSTAEKWLVHVPFSIYLGWITVATIANVTSLLDYLGWNGWGISPQVWAVIMLLAAVVISGIMSFTRGDIAYSLVLIWAFVGIAVKHQGTALVATSAWAASILVGILLVVGVVFNRRRS
jgi:benzodiazapine receptor